MEFLITDLSLNKCLSTQNYYETSPIFYMIYLKWEGVRTSNFTTTTGHFFQNIESVFLVHHYYYNQNIKNGFLVDHYYDKNQTFDVLILPMASKKITTSKIKISSTYGILPMVTKACGALGG